ncbi:hypothetical protein DRW42_23785 [Pedobacter miscanthi]|uniref:Uncharacterized protein n=1 Tax=Pedobacter miscanthi TaxID=2259170 RepID=A0A366KQ98_9SPHI|nr:hypothetical protein DRW42_23785 [Pedobacter miscanthi]
MKNIELLIINIGKKTTLVSFLGGTILFLSFCLFRADFLIPSGIIYLSTAIIFNLLVMLALIISSFIYAENRSLSVSTMLLQLVNIPIAIMYFLIVTTILL